MKKLLLIFMLMSGILSAQPASVQTDQNWGFVKLATYTFDIATDEVLDINDVFGRDNLEENQQIKGFKFRVYNGNVIVAPKGVVATGTYQIGESVASGTVFGGWSGLRIPRNGEYNMVIAPFDDPVTVVFWAW